MWVREGNRTAVASAAIGLLALALVLIPATAGAATASWTFEPASHDFGARLPTEGASEPFAFELTNDGDVQLSPILVTVVPKGEGEGEGEFTIAGNGCRHTLQPGATCAIEIIFTARRAGHTEATLEVFEEDGSAPPAVATLTGTGRGSTLAVEPPSVDFGTVEVDDLDPPQQTVTITNQGPLDLTRLTVELRPRSEDSPLAFPSLEYVGSTCGPYYEEPLPPGGSCTSTLAFRPSVVGPQSAELVIAGRGLEATQTVMASGTGVAEITHGPPPVHLPGPRATLIRVPTKRTKSRVATFAFSGNETTTSFRCRLDSQPYRPCTSPVRYRSLKPGKHHFRLLAISSIPRAGTAGAPSSYNWRVLAPPARKPHRHRGR
jgi:hypothetical protein